MTFFCDGTGRDVTGRDGTGRTDLVTDRLFSKNIILDRMKIRENDQKKLDIIILNVPYNAYLQN